VAFPSKRIREFLAKRKKKAVYNRDTYRVILAADIHACNTCQAWETKSELCRAENETPILHEPWCKFYPSLANIELEHRLEESGDWLGSKWDPKCWRYDENVERTKKAVKESKEKAKAFWASFGVKK
jgi:hypothetical protein